MVYARNRPLDTLGDRYRRVKNAFSVISTFQTKLENDCPISD